jgi:hypothetical protein
MRAEEGAELYIHSFLVSVLDENGSVLMYTVYYLRCVTVALYAF